MNLVAIVLAAGSGTRFGGGKLSAEFKGEPLIAHAIHQNEHMLPARRGEAATPGVQPLAQELGDGIADNGVGMVQHPMLRILTNPAGKARAATMRRSESDAP